MLLNQFSELAGSHDLRLPEWGPYSTKYQGISHIPDVRKGMRFDLTVFPGLYRRKALPPNVNWETDAHAIDVSAFLSTFGYRFNLSRDCDVYADVSYYRVDPTAYLIRMRCVNKSDIAQNLAMHTAASINFPPLKSGNPETARLGTIQLPKEACWVDALAYDSFRGDAVYARDQLLWDGAVSGEMRGHGFVGGSALYLEAGRNYKLDYQVPVFRQYQMPRLLIRYKTSKPATIVVTFGDRPPYFVTLKGASGFNLHELILKKETAADLQHISINAAGNPHLLIDGFVIIEAEQVKQVTFSEMQWNHVPELAEGPGNSIIYEYENVDTLYGLGWLSNEWELREFYSDEIDSLIHHAVHDPSQGILHGEGEGHFTSVWISPIILPPNSDSTHHAIICKGNENKVMQTLGKFAESPKQYYPAGQAAIRGIPELTCNSAGAPHRNSQKHLADALLSNIVYPVRTRGSWIRHYTPSPSWRNLGTAEQGFISLGLAELDVERAIDSLNAYLTEPDEQGAVFIHHGAMLPVQFYTAHELWNKTQFRDILEYTYPRLRQFYRFLVGHSESSTTRTFKSNLLRPWDYTYSPGGWDDYPAQLFVTENNAGNSITPAATTAHTLRAAKIMQCIADELGMDSTEYGKDIYMLTSALNTYAWDQEAGCYSFVQHDRYGRAESFLRHESGVNYNLGLDGVTPLISGICTFEQEQRLVDMLMRPDHLWTPSGITGVSQSAPYFSRSGIWNGNVLISHQWFFWKTMLDLGLPDEAWKIASTALEVWQKESEASFNCYEFFIAETGRGAGLHNVGGLSAPLLCFYNACFKPGTITGGLNMWVKQSAFSSTNEDYHGELRFIGIERNEPIILLCMKEGITYQATWNSVPVPHTERVPGLLEVRLPAGNQTGVLTVNATQ